MILVDTSAWVEFFRRTGSDTNNAVRQLLIEDAPLLTTDVVIMEVLAGARSENHERELRDLLGQCQHVPAGGRETYEVAAALYRRCRRAGETVRSLSDCLVAAVALGAGATVLHNDRDFDVLARHTEVSAVQGIGAA